MTEFKYRCTFKKVIDKANTILGTVIKMTKVKLSHTQNIVGGRPLVEYCKAPSWLIKSHNSLSA